MTNFVSMEQLLDDLKTSDFYLNCRIPMIYSAGFPVLRILNGCLCVTIPFLRYQVTGETDKTLIYPIRYGITLELPTLKVVAFEDYEYRREFGSVEFDRPVGLFRHEAIRHLDRRQYKEAYHQLMICYDTLISALLSGTEVSRQEHEEMSRLMQMLMEPSVMPMYRVLAPDFYDRYLMKG